MYSWKHWKLYCSGYYTLTYVERKQKRISQNFWYWCFFQEIWGADASPNLLRGRVQDARNICRNHLIEHAVFIIACTCISMFFDYFTNNQYSIHLAFCSENIFPELQSSGFYQIWSLEQIRNNWLGIMLVFFSNVGLCYHQYIYTWISSSLGFGQEMIRHRPIWQRFLSSVH